MGWSLYGAPLLQPVAISGKSAGPRNREKTRNPLPRAATGCVRSSMVRRRSPVRVRKRASQIGQQVAFLVASAAYTHRSIVTQSVPKICPQHLRTGRRVESGKGLQRPSCSAAAVVLETDVSERRRPRNVPAPKVDASTTARTLISAQCRAVGSSRFAHYPTAFLHLAGHRFEPAGARRHPSCEPRL
jgi:hypothetical protein